MSPFAIPLPRAQAARIRELYRDKRVRKVEGAFIIEGAKSVYDVLIHQPACVQMLVAVPDHQHRETDQQRLIRESIDVGTFVCPDRLFSSLSSLENPPGILAVVKQPQWNEDEVFSHRTLFGLYAEQVQDPANVGAIVRTAAALNIDALWLTPESADVYNPKVVRATAGSLLSLPIFIIRDVATFTRKGCAMFTAETARRETVEMESIRDAPKRLVLALGNESRGLSGQTIKQAACRFTISLARDIDSLNVAATAAIAIHYFGRLPKKKI